VCYYHYNGFDEACPPIPSSSSSDEVGAKSWKTSRMLNTRPRQSDQVMSGRSWGPVCCKLLRISFSCASTVDPKAQSTNAEKREYSIRRTKPTQAHRKKNHYSYVHLNWSGVGEMIDACGRVLAIAWSLQRARSDRSWAEYSSFPLMLSVPEE
jgi:hypothetical protein